MTQSTLESVDKFPGVPGVVEALRDTSDKISLFLSGVNHLAARRDRDSNNMKNFRDAVGREIQRLNVFAKIAAFIKQDTDSVTRSAQEKILGQIDNVTDKYREILSHVQVISEILQADKKGDSGALTKRVEILYGKPFENPGLGELLQGHLSLLREELLLAAHERTQERLESRMTQLRKDPLTGLPNRGVMDEAFEICDKTPNVGVSVLMIDADHFKKVNDTHGHDAGDKVLRILAEVISHSVRELRKDALGERPGKSGFASVFKGPAGLGLDRGLACRPGGEEFVVIVPGPPHVGRLVAERICENVRKAFKAGVSLDSGQIIYPGTTVSCGVAYRSPDTQEPMPAVLKLADQAAYKAKERGRDQVVVAEPPHEKDRPGPARDDPRR